MGKQDKEEKGNSTQTKHIKLRWKKSQDASRVAQLLFKNTEYSHTASKTYYAVYYAAQAFLLKQGKNPTTHKGVDILFRKYCVSHSRPQVTFAKILSVLRQTRLDADYAMEMRISRKEIQEILDMASTFLKEIKKLLKS